MSVEPSGFSMNVSRAERVAVQWIVDEEVVAAVHRIDGVLGQVGADPDLGDECPLAVVGPVAAGLDGVGPAVPGDEGAGHHAVFAPVSDVVLSEFWRHRDSGGLGL